MAHILCRPLMVILVMTMIWNWVLGPGELEGWGCWLQTNHMPVPQYKQMPRLSHDRSTSWHLVASKTGRQAEERAPPGKAAVGADADTTDSGYQCWGLPICILPPHPSAPPWGKAGQVPWEQGHGNNLLPVQSLVLLLVVMGEEKRETQAG